MCFLIDVNWSMFKEESVAWTVAQCATMKEACSLSSQNLRKSFVGIVASQESQHLGDRDCVLGAGWVARLVESESSRLSQRPCLSKVESR